MRVARSLAIPLAAIGLLAASDGRAAGFFDGIVSIFGEDPQPLYESRQAPARSYYRYEDLDLAEPGPPRRERAERQPAQDAKPVDTAIDPAKVPDWYLSDPTLRRGDIVVLLQGVFVYQGRVGNRAPDDFVPLERSRLSATEKARVAGMTGYRPPVQAAGLSSDHRRPMVEATLNR